MPAGHGAQRFAWRPWNGNVVVFDRRYGDTHALSGLLASVFEAWLATGSTDLAILSRQIGEIPTASPDELPPLAAALRDLQQRGLLPSP
jgi:hypothetical protein